MTNDQALSAKLWPRPVPLAQLRRRVHEAPLWRWALNSFIYSEPRDARAAGLEHPGRLRVLAAALARPRRGLPGRAGRADAAAAGDGRAALRDVGEARTSIGTLWPLIIPNWFGDAFAIFLLRQFFLTIPRGVPRRRARRRLRRVPHPHHGRAAAREAGDRRRGAVLGALHWNDFFLPLLYVGENPDNWVASIGLSQFRTLHQVQWNLTMAATLLVMAPRDRPLLPRAEGVRRGRHADGGEGMKVAVIGGGLDVHARARLRPLARARPHRRARARRCTTSTRERREVVGGHGAADARRGRASAATLEVTGDLDRAVDGADFVLVQIRVGGQAARLSDETVPLALRLHRPGDDRRRRLRQGAAHGAGRARDRRARARARRGRRVDRRLHEPGRDRHARAARRRSPRRRALQRRDRLPAPRSRGCSASSPSASPSTRSGSTT